MEIKCLRTIPNHYEDECEGHVCVICGKIFYCFQEPKHECPPNIRQTGGHELGVKQPRTYDDKLSEAEELKGESNAH